MRSAKSSLVVGIVILMGIGAFIVVFSTAHRGFKASVNAYEVIALFDNVNGLNPGTRVTIAGVQVGEIKSIALDPSSPDLARIRISIDGDVRLFEGIQTSGGEWKNGATVTRKQASMLGDHYLELTRGITGQQLRNGGRVRIVVSSSGLSAVFKQLERSGKIFDRFDQIFNQLEGIAKDVKKVTSSVARILGGEEGTRRLDNIAGNIATAASDIKVVGVELKKLATDVHQFLAKSILGRGDQIGNIIRNIERFSSNAAMLSRTTAVSVGRILGDVKSVTKTVRTLISGSKGDVESSIGTIKGTLASVTQSLKRLNGILSNVSKITNKINQGKGTLGRLINNDKVLKGIEDVVTDAGDIVKRVRRLQTRIDLRSEFYFEQKALKNYLQLRFQPRKDKYYLLEIIDDPRGKTSFKKKVTQTNDPTLPPVVNETAATTTEGIKISFQFAKKWYFVTARFGIFEGTGGVGLDAEFLRDSLRFTMDLFDFAQDEHPRMRLLANYEFFKHFYVSVGIDDIFNESSMDWFIGGGIRFTDDDLKSVLIAAPTPSL